MPLNITSYSTLSAPQGVPAQAASLDSNTTAQVVALGAASTAISGPVLLSIIADEDQRIAVSQTPGYNAPAATGVKIKAGVERYYSIAAGTWYISCVAG